MFGINDLLLFLMPKPNLDHHDIRMHNFKKNLRLNSFGLPQSLQWSVVSFYYHFIKISVAELHFHLSRSLNIEIISLQHTCQLYFYNIWFEMCCVISPTDSSPPTFPHCICVISLTDCSPISVSKI